MTEKASTYDGLKIVHLINGIGKMDRYVQRDETTRPSYTTHKNEFKVDKDFVTPETIKNPIRKHRQ